MDDKTHPIHYTLPMTTQRGFTLVELSIVLVILGLLIGGVLTGQSLIRAAELRSVTTQQARYVTAVQTFRDKYFALPGDMTNATAYWGTASACPGDYTTPSTTASTCNGDGNGKIDINTGSNEQFRFWQQLANAGLIEGSYSGEPASTGNSSVTTLNAPAGRISSSLWHAFYWSSPHTGDSTAFDGTYENGFQFGLVQTNNSPYGAALRPEEAYNIDTKVDDGKPATGKVVMRAAGGWAVCTDASASTTLTANYLLSSTALSCALLFRQAF